MELISLNTYNPPPPLSLNTPNYTLAHSSTSNPTPHDIKSQPEHPNINKITTPAFIQQLNQSKQIQSNRNHSKNFYPSSEDPPILIATPITDTTLLKKKQDQKAQADKFLLATSKI